MNFISVGCQCHNAIALRKLNLLKESLPFDSIGSNIPGILKILKQEASVKDFLTLKPDSKYNILGFWLGHFLPSELESIRQRVTNNEPIESIFERRINRLLNCFYNQPNILIYNNFNRVWNKASYEDMISMEELVSLNPQNQLFILSRKDILFDKYNKHTSIVIEYADFDKPEHNQQKILDFIEKICHKYFI